MAATPPSQLTRSTRVAHKLIRQRRNVIFENFQKLTDKRYAPGDPSYSIVFVDTDRKTWKNALNQLQITTLP
ncbi:hypothetical protein PCASD_17850 [Puccinia coronata f. sp. avenae]|uniref:Uncharacterized protein n=1 Tax=Puccinia coronata f. sp. avenae TaxID=200324 RepID=A0A2N5TQC5_9BASI|nr:hypothetical protein PCASD_17850 [Puccinia coronata f. sp. avenae]